MQIRPYWHANHYSAKSGRCVLLTEAWETGTGVMVQAIVVEDAYERTNLAEWTMTRTPKMSPPLQVVCWLRNDRGKDEECPAGMNAESFKQRFLEN